MTHRDETDRNQDQEEDDTEKVLWVVNLSDSGVRLDELLSKARAVRASAVSIRTTATNFEQSIPAFHEAGIKVLAWRRPPVDRESALAQARRVVELMRIGLDGFQTASGRRGRVSDYHRGSQ